MSTAPPRLALAFSGGGFRAAFFHLGVLRRLAELDLLRHVTTISTVSGGSILAGLYYLHFKRVYHEKQGVLATSDYLEIVKEVEGDFARANRRDLRNRLFTNPLTHLKAIVLGRSYGRPMASLYARYFYGRVKFRVFGEGFLRKGVPLHLALVHDQPHTTDTKILKEQFPSKGYPGLRHRRAGKTLRERNLAPADETCATRPAIIPKIVMNATCLNTGGSFAFMLNEVGGPDIGFVRIDEVLMLVQYKMLLRDVGAAAGSWEAAWADSLAVMTAAGPGLIKEFRDCPTRRSRPISRRQSTRVSTFSSISTRRRCSIAAALPREPPRVRRS